MDATPKTWCCDYSDKCDTFYSVRPMDKCDAYSAPILGGLRLSLNQGSNMSGPSFMEHTYDIVADDNPSKAYNFVKLRFMSLRHSCS